MTKVLRVGSIVVAARWGKVELFVTLATGLPLTVSSTSPSPFLVIPTSVDVTKAVRFKALPARDRGKYSVATRKKKKEEETEENEEETQTRRRTMERVWEKGTVERID